MYKYLKNNYIRRPLAVMLIAIFALSNTPKQQLHNIFADHSDVSLSGQKSSKQNLSKAEFHCNCDNLVVIAPFIPATVYFSTHITYCPITFNQAKSSDLPLFQKIFFELRGPPTFA